MRNLRFRCKPPDAEKCYLRDCLPAWEMFNICFPRGIRIGDLDGIVEMNGLFLIMEWKRSNPEIPKGQLLTFKALARTGLFTIVIMYGQPMTDLQVFGRKGEIKKRPANSLDAVAVVSKWAKYAENGS